MDKRWMLICVFVFTNVITLILFMNSNSSQSVVTRIKYVPIKNNNSTGMVVEKIISETIDDDNPTILILTPLKDASGHLERYFQNIAKLDYPKHKISLGFLVSDSSDSTWTLLESFVHQLQNDSSENEGYRRITYIKKDFGYHIPGWDRHAQNIQVERRAALAKSRNFLLFTTLRDEDYTMWIDSDLWSFPADLIRKMLSTKKDIVVPNCVMEHGGRSYDLNSFKETDSSRSKIQNMEKAGKDFVILEGYSDNGRLSLSKLRSYGDLVEIDGVGGAVLFIKADLHRQGLIFPTFNYKHQIETEGLAKMTIDMGFQPYGMPNYEVIHL